MTFFLTMPGIPFIYYGDEIGMKFQMNLPNKEGSNERSGTRTPMQWTKGKNAGFSTSCLLYTSIQFCATKIVFYTDNHAGTIKYLLLLVTIRQIEINICNLWI